jgi:hypothetical protein
MMLDYESLDSAICTWLQKHPVGHPANSAELQALAAPLAAGEAWRLIDRRMQALRHSGRIHYAGRRRGWHGWRVAAPEGVAGSGGSRA